MDKEHFIYILKSKKNNKLYTRITDNFERRFAEHNKGSRSTPSTFKKGPFELRHVEIAKNRVEVREVEKFLKSGFGREMIKEMMVALAQR